MTLAALRHPDAEVRRQSIAALDPAAIDRERASLLALLDDPDWRVRREVALAIARAHDASALIGPLVDSVERGDVARRNAAMEALRHIGPSVAPTLLARLNLVGPTARRFLVELLADVGDAGAVAALEQLLSGDDANVAHAAAESLARIDAPSAQAALTRALDNPEAVVRLAVLQAFAARRRPLQWALLEPLTRDLICRRAALLAAAYTPEPEAFDAILRALSQGGPLASSAVIALGHRVELVSQSDLSQRLSERSIADVLVDIAERATSVDARRAALQCIAIARRPESIAVVLASIDSPETMSAGEAALEAFDAQALPVAVRCVDSLGQVAALAMLRWARAHDAKGHDDALVRLAERWLDGGARSVVLWDTIASLGDQDAVRRLAERVVARAATLDPHEVGAAITASIARFADVAPVYRRVAPVSAIGVLVAAALAKAHLPVDEPALYEALSSGDATIRSGALRALAELDPRAMSEAVAFALADEDPSVQTVAAELLGRRGEGRELLVASLSASDPRVRRAAAAAVARWSDGAPRVRTLLDDPEPSVVLAALEALGDRISSDELVALTRHDDADVVAQALATLRAIDASRASTVAAELLSHAVWSVRLEAVRALVNAGAVGRERLAQARSSERDELVVEAIDAALGAGGAGT
ncbi:MAG: HEAT repeat domain-containing protein [Polyangiales bacterium]